MRISDWSSDVCSSDLDQRRDHRAGVRPLDRDDRPLFGRRGEPDAKVGPFGLEVILHHVQHAGGAARRRGDVEAIRRESAYAAIAAADAVLPQQHAVTALATAALRPGLDVNAVPEPRGVAPAPPRITERLTIQ